MMSSARPSGAECSRPGCSAPVSFSPHFSRSALLACLIGLAFLLAGCGPLLANLSPTQAANSTQTPQPLPGTPEPVQTATFEPVSTLNTPTILTIWVPPQFDPNGDHPAGALLQARLDEFTRINPNVVVEVRVKAASGPGSLLEALTAASAAAPKAVPALIILNRADLESAALKGLIFPYDGLSTAIEDPDWYGYARQLAMIETSTYGLPFAGDALLLLYRAGMFPEAPATWDDIIARGEPVIFQADDPAGLTTLALYKSAGGVIQDNQGRPYLEIEPLSAALKLYDTGARKGTFPGWLAQIQSTGQAWQAYQDQRANMVVTWSSNYLSELPVDTTAANLPSLSNDPYTYATGWMWALSDPNPERRNSSIKLAEFLVESGFMSEWTEAAGYLPTRPTALAGWKNQSLQALLSQSVLTAQIRPANQILASIGPILREATLDMILQKSAPAQAAQVAVERLGNP